MGGDGPVTQKPEAKKVVGTEANSNANDLGEMGESNLTLTRMAGEPAAGLAKMSFRALETAAVEAMLPALLLGPPPGTWKKPEIEYRTAVGLFPAGSDTLKLAEKKKDNPPLSNEEEAKLSAGWLFLQSRNGSVPKQEFKDAYDLAVRNNLDPKDLNDEERLTLAMRTVQVISERKQRGQFALPDGSGPEQLDEKKEYNEAWDILTKRMQWSTILDAKGNPVGGKLIENTKDTPAGKELRKEVDRVIIEELKKKTGNLDLNIGVDYLREFVRATRDGKAPHTLDAVLLEGRGGKPKVYEPAGDPKKIKIAQEMVKSGKAMSRDDALNRLILDKPLEPGAPIMSHYRHCFAIVTNRE